MLKAVAAAGAIVGLIFSLFSSIKDERKRIKTYETDGKVYLNVYGVFTEEGFKFLCLWFF